MPRGNIFGLRRDKGSEAFEADGELPEGDRYRGHWMLVSGPDGRTRAYKVSRLKRTGDHSLIFIDGESGLEPLPPVEGRTGQEESRRKYRETYFPHQEFDGGLGSFMILDAAWTTH